MLFLFMKKRFYYTAGLVLVVFVLVFMISSNISNEELKNSDESEITSNSLKEEDKTNSLKENNEKDNFPEKQTGQKPDYVDYSKYSFDYADDESVRQKVNNIIGENGKTGFYLPPTGYINVSSGDSYGVVYGINNPNPSGENYFKVNWQVDESIENSCGVSEGVGQSWIKRGWSTFGVIPKGWIDHLTVYFEFPQNVSGCKVKYNVEITKDDKFYDSKQLEFNII
jgi:hypothetical protein